MLILVWVLAFFSAVLATDNPPFRQGNDTEKYYVSLIQLEFLQAYATCKRYGWALATELNAEESAAINATLISLGSTSSVYWLAGFRQIGGEFNPVWMWFDSGEEIEYTNWISGEPTDADNCIGRMSLSTASGKWESFPCTSEELFICQKE